MSLIQSIFLGILQGITEFLPISSSGQLVIAEYFLNLKSIEPSSMKIFDIMLHTGSLVALMILFQKEIFEILSFLTFKKNKKSLNGKKMFYLLVIGSLPAVIFGLFLEDFFDENFRNIQAVAILLIITGIIFIAAEKISTKKEGKEINMKKALVIGVFQAFAILPGFSRSGLTISGGLFQGIERQKAAKFSFLLAMPIIFGASMISIIKIITNGLSVNLHLSNLLIGFTASALVSYFTAKYLLKMFRKIPLTIFSVFLFFEGITLLLFLAKVF